MRLQNLIEESHGKWSEDISNIEYTFIKGASDNAMNEAYLDEKIEDQLSELPVPEHKGKRRKWLVKIICEIFHDNEVIKEINNTVPDERKKQLLQIIIDKILEIVPSLNPYIKIIVRIVVYLIKLIFKKGIERLCTE
jgi:hypothetical protein